MGSEINKETGRVRMGPDTGKTPKHLAVATGQPVNCYKHGLHSNWKIYNNTNVRCVFCSRETSVKYKKDHHLRWLIKNANQRSYEVTIDEDFLLALLKAQNNTCALTGLPFDDENLPSLDRIDPDKGYTKDNVQLVLIDVNYMKQDLKQEEFIALCKAVIRKNAGN